MTDYRDNWIVANVFAEIPILGSFAKKHNFYEAMNDAGKCVASLIGSTLAMEYAQNGSEIEFYSAVNSTAIMALGMLAAKVVYNSSREAVIFSKQSCELIYGEHVVSNEVELIDQEHTPIINASLSI